MFILTACTSGDAPEAAAAPRSAVLQPGGPGEPAETTAPEDVVPLPPDAPHNDADAEFVTDMIGHHDQAVEMSAWAPDRATTDAVLTFADRIQVAQDAEIDLMSTWLTDRGLPVPRQADPGDGSGPRAPEGHEHDSATMPGMLSEQEMAGLKASDGREFDRRFLRSMIRHHEGAITMCEDVYAYGSEQYIARLAETIAVDQAMEISRMEQLLADM